MRRALPCLFIFALLLPLHAQLASGDVLEDSVDAWKAVEKETDEEQAWQMEDDRYQSLPEVFPNTSSDGNQSAVDRQMEERIGSFVSVNVDGKLLVLRDVPRSSWFAPYVREIAEQGIVSGYRDSEGRPTGLFGPAASVTIEQMAKVMIYASGRLDEDCAMKQPLNLTSSGTWSAQFISCAEKHDWVVFSDGTADARRPAMRSEVVMTLIQAFGVTPAARTGSGFTDVTLSTQFGSAIEQAQRDGIVSGYTDESGIPTGLFGPLDPVTRAEFAKIVTLGLQMYAAKEDSD